MEYHFACIGFLELYFYEIDSVDNVWVKSFRALELVVFDLFSFVSCLDFISFRNFVFIL